MTKEDLAEVLTLIKSDLAEISKVEREGMSSRASFAIDRVERRIALAMLDNRASFNALVTRLP